MTDSASLMHGWIPVTVQLLAGVALLACVGWRTRVWQRRSLPIAVAAGIGVVTLARWYDDTAGLSGGEPWPYGLWIWIGLTGVAAAVLAVGWRGARWWRRALAALCVTLCVLSALLALNLWTGYFETVSEAYDQLSGQRLPNQSDAGAVASMQQHGNIPTTGHVVPVTIDTSASGFASRDELVYLPPAWFATKPPPPLPTIVVVGGVLNLPDDWIRHGHAIKTLDAFAALHGGAAPVVVFADSSGSFANDTECVNGPRGNAADHLVKDVVPFMVSQYGVSASPANWAVAGFSMGGTCAVDLAVMHPETFSTFDDISGDMGPNDGNEQQTIDRLFGGDSTAWTQFDPATVLLHHSPYRGFAGRFDVDAGAPDTLPDGSVASDVVAAERPRPGDHLAAAQRLCGLGRLVGVDCEIIQQPGSHDWPFARNAFADALPWLAGRIGTPGVAPRPLSDANTVRVPTYAPAPGA